MDLTFKSVEKKFENLKSEFQTGKISRQDFIEGMKKLRLRDESGRFWMIGAQSGKWYFFDGKDWVQAEPPTLKDKKVICVYCGFENAIDAESCARCGGAFGEEKSVCPTCGGELQKPYLFCPRCEKEPASLKEMKFVAVDEGRGMTKVVLRAVQPLSVLFFGGLFGALVGIVLGIFAGATAYFSGNLAFLPAALTELQGKLLGAVIFGLAGGIVGFVFFALAGYFKAVIINFVLSLIGGIKITATRKDVPFKPEDPTRPES
jgi:hypothetical protein